MHSTPLPKANAHAWATYASWALAFDWMYEHPSFNAALKDRVAQQPLDGAIVMASTPDLNHPEQASFHNYTTRFLGLTTFALSAVGKCHPHDASVEDLRDKAARTFQNILDVFQLGFAER